MQKDVRKRNVKNAPKKEKINVKTSKNNKKILIKVLFTFISLLLVLLITVFGIYLYTNNKIYNLVQTSGNDTVIEYRHYFKKLYLSEKVQNEIKSKNINLKVNYAGSSSVILAENITKENDIYIDLQKLDTQDIVEFPGSIAMYIPNNNFLEMYIKLPKCLEKYTNLDIYVKKADSTFKMYMPYVSKDENLTVKIERYMEGEILGYALVYTKLDDIEIINMQENILNLGKGQNSKLDIKYIPENATDKNLKLTSDNEELLTIDEGMNLCPLSVGDVVLNIDSQEVSKKINVHISNYVTAINLNTNNLTLYKGDKYTINHFVTPDDAENKEIVFEVSDSNVISLESNIITAQNIGSSIVTAKTTTGNIIESKITVNVIEKKQVKNTSDVGVTYINGILIANKTYSLPSTYNPGGLTKATMDAFNKMKQAAAKDGISLWISSGFRSYATQARLYSNYVAGYGQAAADTFSARAGHSEHQTGLAMDVNYIEDWFGDTKEGKWLADNCHKYGFIIRYPKNKEHLTGYKYEPWHIRYLGTDTATAVYNSGLCLEEYLNITSKYSE